MQADIPRCMMNIYDVDWWHMEARRCTHTHVHCNVSNVRSRDRQKCLHNKMSKIRYGWGRASWVMVANLYDCMGLNPFKTGHCDLTLGFEGRSLWYYWIVLYYTVRCFLAYHHWWTKFPWIHLWRQLQIQCGNGGLRHTIESEISV